MSSRVTESESETDRDETSHDRDRIILNDDAEESELSLYKAQLWVTALTTWGAVLYTLYAFTVEVNQVETQVGFRIIIAVGVVVWINPIIGLVAILIRAIKESRRQSRRHHLQQEEEEEEESRSLMEPSTWMMILVGQRLIFMLNLLGILWIMFLPKVSEDLGSRVVQYIFLLCPYILCINSLFQCHLTHLWHLFCCCCNCLDIHTEDEFSEDSSAVNSPTIDN